MPNFCNNTIILSNQPCRSGTYFYSLQLCKGTWCLWVQIQWWWLDFSKETFLQGVLFSLFLLKPQIGSLRVTGLLWCPTLKKWNLKLVAVGWRECWLYQLVSPWCSLVCVCVDFHSLFLPRLSCEPYVTAAQSALIRPHSRPQRWPWWHDAVVVYRIICWYGVRLMGAVQWRREGSRMCSCLYDPNLFHFKSNISTSWFLPQVNTWHPRGPSFKKPLISHGYFVIVTTYPSPFRRTPTLNDKRVKSHLPSVQHKIINALYFYTLYISYTF